MGKQSFCGVVQEMHKSNPDVKDLVHELRGLSRDLGLLQTITQGLTQEIKKLGFRCDDLDKKVEEISKENKSLIKTRGNIGSSQKVRSARTTS